MQRLDHPPQQLNGVGDTRLRPRGESAQRNVPRRGCADHPPDFASPQCDGRQCLPGYPALPHTRRSTKDDPGHIRSRDGGLDDPHLLRAADQAREQVTRARAITRDLRLKWPEAFTFQLAGYIEMLGDDAVAAEEAMRAAQTLFREVGDAWALSLVTVELSTALYHQGRYDEALELTEAFDEVPAPYDTEWQIKRRGIRAKALARRGELAEAETLAHETVELAATTDFSTFHGDALIDLAEVLRIAGRAAEAKPAVEHAVTLYERKGNIVSAGKARTLLRELQRRHSSLYATASPSIRRHRP